MKIRHLLLIICFITRGMSQNLDISTNLYSGKYSAMAGAGIALAEGIYSVDINPAGVAYSSKRAFSISQYVNYHRYSLFNVRKEENLSRLFEWSKITCTLQSLLLTYPINKKFSIAIGYLNRIRPYLYNERRAITWSPLFNQETNGSINSIVLSSAYHILHNFSIGISGYLYFGSVISRVQGENHGKDTDKWAELKNSVFGNGIKIGIKYKYNNFRTGLVFEIPHYLSANSEKKLSDNPLYGYLFPDYNTSKIKIPLSLGIGIAYLIGKELTITTDYEFKAYKRSKVQLNLYEYGGDPNWKDLSIFRIGVEYIDLTKKWIPIRIGYAYIPQLYASNETTGNWYNIDSYQNTDQNIKHLFTSGTSIYFKNFELNLSIQYSFLKWHRDFYTNIFVDEDYQEDVYTFWSEFIYFF